MLLKIKTNKSNRDISFNLPINESYEIGLGKEDKLLGGVVEREKEENTNEIVNYEKNRYSPMYDNVEVIDEIDFNIYFRKKEINNIETGTTIYNDEMANIDYGTWSNNDYEYWNKFDLDGNFIKDKKANGDLFKDFGFTDDDIYYRKSVVSESFLRLLFYDTKDRATQKLLFYSTIHFDTNNLYKQYLDSMNSSTGRTAMVQMYKDRYDYILTNIDGEIVSTLSCGKVNDLSSDGFYLYLFDNIDFDKTGGTDQKIYMKAEFNNAKFGKTVPLLFCDTYDSNDSAIIVSGFTDSGNTMVNMDKLYDKMYCEISLYKKEEGYKWDLRGNKDNTISQETPTITNRKIIISLYEPRLY